MENKEQVNHINGIKDDNCITNLEWCSPKENCIHSGKLHLRNRYASKLHKISYQITNLMKKCNDVEIIKELDNILVYINTN